MSCLVILFLILFVKIAVSDVLKGVNKLNENIKENRLI